MELKLLEECCEILDSMRVPITAVNRQKGIYPYYGANGVQDYVKDYLFDDELVLLAEDGGNFGNKVKPIAYRVSGKCWVNNHAHVLKPKPGINVDYLCYALMFYNVDDLINGATRKKLTQSAMRKMKIPVRSLEEQEKIIKRLNSILQVKKFRETQKNLLDELVKARFVEMFGTVKENPYNFPTATLKEVCHKITDGKHGGCEQEANSGYYYIGAREIYDGAIHYDTAPQITYADFAKDYRRCNIEQGDMVIVNTGATIGKSAIAVSPLTERTLLQKSVALLKVKTNMVSAGFLRYCYMANPSMYMVKSASAQPNLLLSKMNATVIYLPPLELQEQFAAFVAQTDKSKFRLEKNTKNFCPEFYCTIMICFLFAVRLIMLQERQRTPEQML